MISADLALILTGFLWSLVFAGYLGAKLAPNPLDEAAERRYQATEAHVRRYSR
jgi:hypothetical protein